MSCADNAVPFRMLAYLLSALGMITSAEGRVIDEFTEGAALLQASSVGGSTVLQTNLDPSIVIGGERYLYAGSTDASRLEIDSTAGVCVFEATQGFGYFTVSYGTTTPLGINLSADGSDAFLLRFSDVYTPDIIRLPPAFLVNGVVYSLWSDVFDLSGGPIEVRIPFSAFTRANVLIANSISFRGARIEPTHRYGLDSIITVPEPSTGFLLTLSIPLVWMLRRPPNRVAGGIDPPAPTPPVMRVRNRRFRSD